MSGNLSLRSILEANKLVGNNFADWYRNLRIVLRQESLIHIVENQPPPPVPDVDASADEIESHNKYLKEETQVTCLMLASMSPELQRQHENLGAIDMLTRLRDLFGSQSRVERYETSKTLFRCKMAEGSSVHDHVIKMIGYIEKLSQLGFNMSHDLCIDLVLQSLPDSFSQFVMNFHMNKMEASLMELLNMLTVAEGNLQKVKAPVMMIAGASKKKKQTFQKNGNKKLAVKKGLKKPKGICHHCGKDGHWRRNCKAYLASLKAKKSDEASGSGMFMIDINLSEKSNASTWVLDTGCGTHICNNVQGLNRSRKLNKNEMDLRVANGAKVAAQAIGTYLIELPSGLVLTLDECYFVPVLSRNLISVSCLDRLGFSFHIKNGLCTFSYDDIVYGTAKLQDNGLYVVEQSKSINILNVNNKKIKLDNSNDSYLWHCRLGHINENRIQKLHKNGFLNNFDYESYATCESCLIGKMTKLSFKGKGERVSDLLGLVHTDVCGPMSTHATGGYSYFITFTDDHSRYGYVYLMKYKNEAFEKFKEFKQEVEKQTRKNVLILKSNRGGEYLSDEF